MSAASSTTTPRAMFTSRAATLMFRDGVHPKVVSERLGHSSIAITLDTYSHVIPSMQRDAADAIAAILATSK